MYRLRTQRIPCISAQGDVTHIFITEEKRERGHLNAYQQKDKYCYIHMTVKIYKLELHKSTCVNLKNNVNLKKQVTK